MTTASAKGAHSRRAHSRRLVAVTARWLHIYLSMASFALVLFFAATGLTLNHADWFAGKQRTQERHGTADKALLRTQDANGADKLAIVELLRSREHVHGAVSDFRVDDAQVSVSFRAAGYTADAFFDRDTGRYDLTEVQNGLVAVMNDLHKGRDTGRAWSLVIDASAIVLVMVSLTGMVLMFFVYRRRVSGFLLAGGMAAAVVALWVWMSR